MMIDAVDLFCGAGGLTAGLIQAGVRVHAGYDIDQACQYAYEVNNQAKFIAQDIETLTTEDVAAWYQPGNIRLLAGCAPCQPFSSYTQGRDTRQDKKWPLLYAFMRLIRGIQPELVTMENVPDVTKHQVYRDFVQSLEELGYSVWADRVSCVDYGLPQQRKRHVLLASKLGPISLIPKTHDTNPVTVEQAIGHLPALAAGEWDKNDPLHRAAKLTDLNMKRIINSRPGGTWRDWPEELRAKCHRKTTGKTYSSVYGRMQWDEPSPTMTTLCYGFGNGRFGHPVQHRAISLREAAIFQSFPANYKFAPPEKMNFKAIGRMIGNAVPVLLGDIIGKSLFKHINKV
ncbi:DNA (cytosine-5)-methyltransferase 1 [Azomonas agilis]|uniref:DNA (cytosine-5-)-methyltransferase n=2 Tax=Azomonas agilis TaxID=116849 RepID=A0A562HZ36_9GAMM|nr:DNA (cytosine-5)-methyltransferase 1 [Azomonas agilis]